MPATPIRFVLVVMLLAAAGPLSAEDSLNEVEVLASWRPTTVRDLPQSVLVVPGEALERHQIQDLSELSYLVPNLTVGFGPVTQAITMRGAGAAQERSLQQSVGLYIDDLYRPRSRQFRQPFFDLEHIEILRGPQAVAYGFNATAGAIHLLTRKTMPGDPYFAEFAADYEFEHGGPSASIIVGGSPLSTLGVRAGLKYRDRDGFFDNTFTGVSDENGARDILMRLSTVWIPNERWTVSAKYEPADYEVHGNSGEIFGPGAVLVEPGDGRLDRRRRADAALIDPFDLFRETGPAATSRIKIITARVDRHRPSGGTYTAIVEHSQFDFELSSDLDLTAATVLDGGNEEDYEMDNLHLRYTSPPGRRLEYLAGYEFLNTDLESDQTDLFGPQLSGPDQPLESTTVYELDATMQAVYAQASWRHSERLTLSGGVRLTSERQEVLRGSRCEVGLLPSTLVPAPPELVAAFCPDPSLNGFEAKRSSDLLLPEVGLTWRAREDLSVYGRLARGGKFGGFSALADALPTDLAYDDEDVTALEAGFKARLADGAADLNAALFVNDYENLQVASLVTIGPEPRAAIASAAAATTSGIELDGRWAVSDSLTLGGALAWLDAEYDDYPRAPCNSVTAPLNADGNCNLSGERLPYAPEFSGSVYADFARRLSPGVNLTAGLRLAFSGDYHTQGNLDPVGEQDSWLWLGARIGIEDPAGVWSLSLVGKNLTDEKILGGSRAFGGYFIGYLEPPRTVLLTGTYRFGR